MALQGIGFSIAWPMVWFTGGALSVANHVTLDASGEYTGIVFVAREAMTISHVGFLIGAATGSPTVDVRIETVDADGLPSGTLWATDTNIVSGALSSDTWNLVALTAPASIAAGQAVAVKFAYASGTSVIFRRVNGLQTTAGSGPPYLVQNTGTPAKAVLGNSNNLSIALGSSTTAFYKITALIPIASVAGSTFSNSTGARRGIRFRLPFACRVAGLVIGAGAATGDFSIALYDDAGNELSSSSTAYDGDHNAASVCRFVFFDNPVTLSIGTWYRAAIIADTATNMQLNQVVAPSLDYMSAMSGGPDCFLTTYATIGGWVDTATSTVPSLSLLLDQLDDGAGAAGGMLVHPGMNGRLAA